MKEHVTVLSGKDLGVVISYDLSLLTHGIVIYKPRRSLQISKGSPKMEIVYMLNVYLETKEAVKIPYDSAKEVKVDGNAVWRNWSYFSEEDVKHLVKKNSELQYFGRGDVSIEFVPSPDIASIVNQILASKVGLTA